MAGVVMVPSMVSGNARRNVGSLAQVSVVETPLVARLTGAAEVPGPGDPDGSGAASISIDVVDPMLAEVCWDMAYRNLGTVTAAHIHPGNAMQANPPVVDFGIPTPNTFTGCADISAGLAQQILDSPANFYVNVHTNQFPGGAIRGQLATGPSPAGPLHLLPAPLRAYDSRSAPAGKFAAGQTRTIDLSTGLDSMMALQTAVPPGATAALVNVTVVQTDAGGFMKIYSASVAEPSTSSSNFAAVGAAVNSSLQVAVSAASEVKVTSSPSSGFHVIIDVVGYYY
jgi:hypothetical protein